MRDLLFFGGTILTMDEQRAEVEALAVRGDKILAVGSYARVKAMLAPDALEVDLEGCCLLPGFHDSHVHLGQHGLALDELDLSETTSLEEALSLIAEHARDLPDGKWIVGSGFALARWQCSSLSSAELDKVSKRHPMFFQSQDHHSAWVNSLALERAAVTAKTVDPEGGRIARDEAGVPQGLLFEHAAALVRKVIPPPSDETLRQAIIKAADDLARLGITTVHHMAYEPVKQWQQIALCASREDYPLRVWACVPQEAIEHATALGLATGQGGKRFMVGGAKFFTDGALGSLTAWMLAPYQGSDSAGMCMLEPEVLLSRVEAAIEAGFVPVTHAIGDAANRLMIDTLAQTAERWQARAMRPRIEHMQHLHPEDIIRVAELGLIASMQPIHMVFDAPQIKTLLADRLHHAYSMKTLRRAGIPLAFGSDTPVAHPDVIQGLRAATDRLAVDGEPFRPEEGLSVQESLAAYTRDAAFAIAWEHHSGQLKAGYDADLVMLSADPRKGLDKLQVKATMLAGHWTFQEKSFIEDNPGP